MMFAEYGFRSQQFVAGGIEMIRHDRSRGVRHIDLAGDAVDLLHCHGAVDNSETLGCDEFVRSFQQIIQKPRAGIRGIFLDGKESRVTALLRRGAPDFESILAKKAALCRESVVQRHARQHHGLRYPAI